MKYWKAKDHNMDTPILIFVIFGLILWIDSKRRNKRIQKRWEEVGGWKPFQLPQVKLEPVPTTAELEDTLWKLHEELTGNKRPEEPETSPDVDDIALKETIQEVIKELTPPNTLVVADAETGLQKLGYKKLQIRKAIASLNIAHKTSAEIITEALPILNK